MIRSQYWIVDANSIVRRLFSKCVVCRCLRGTKDEQNMADLPKERITPSPPFNYCGVDHFGPFFIKQERKEAKRYGTIFSCLATSKQPTHWKHIPFLTPYGDLLRWNPTQDFCVGGAGSHPELLVGFTGFHSKIWAGYYEGSSEFPLRILDWIGGTPLGIGGIWPPIFTCGTKEKMFFDSLLLTASVGSMFTFLVYDFMNIQILWLFFC